MTDGFDQAIVNAGLGLLQADPQLTVFDGKVPPGTVPPYVQVYGYVERPYADPSNATDGKSRVLVARWVCHCVGGGDDAVAARAVAQRVRTALLDQRVVISGIATGLIRQEQADPPTRDESTGELLMDALCVYALFATV